MPDSLDTWFQREILIHEDLLMRFLARAWPRPDEHADLRQEAYTRIYEAARTSRPRAPKAFLFATTRHLMADRIRRERVVSIQAAGDQDFSNVLRDDITPERAASAAQELARLAKAFDQLPPKCRKVVWMRRVLELSQKEVAAALGISVKTVEMHIAHGGGLLAHYLAGGDPPPDADAEPEDLIDLNEKEHP